MLERSLKLISAVLYGGVLQEQTYRCGLHGRWFLIGRMGGRRGGEIEFWEEMKVRMPLKAV